MIAHQSLTDATPLATQIAGWSPGTVTRTDPLDTRAAQSLHDLLATGPTPHTGGPIAPLHHWAYFHSWPSPASLGPDGHPRSGEFLPPVRDRRRMFAGGRCTFHAPLYFGQPAVATSALANQQIKRGRTGELLLVTVRTTITQDQRLCITDEQEFVYRSGPPQPAPDTTSSASQDVSSSCPSVTADHAISRRRGIAFDPVALFRFSALTANSHRIHYDLSYARDVEGYDGLLVQGPLLILSMATLLLMPPGTHQPSLAALTYRLRRPVFCDESVELIRADSAQEEPSGDGIVAPGSSAPAQLAIIDAHGRLRASATAEFQHDTARNP